MKKLISTLLIAAFAVILCSGCTSKPTEEFNLETAKIGVLTGSTGERYVDEYLTNAKKLSYANILDSYAALLAGKIDAVILDQPNLVSAVSRNKELVLLNEETLTSESTSIGIKKGNDELLKDIDDAISKLKSDGTLEDMTKRWVKLDGTDVEPMSVEESSGETLKVGVAPVLEPFCYISHNTITGFDIELINRIGLELDRKIELVQMDFGALISSLKSGKVDVIISLITASDERKLSIDFSQSYYESGQAVIINRKSKK